MAAVITPTEDQVFDAMWAWVVSLFDVSVQPYVFKGFQNMTATPYNSYVVVSPGVKERQDQIRRTYDSANSLVNEQRHTTYAYQVDCYGQAGPDYADIISVAWRSMWACDQLDGAVITPLYADEPTQLNFSNGEQQYEQRFMLRLYAQVNQTVSLPQDFFVGPVPVQLEIPADLLAP